MRSTIFSHNAVFSRSYRVHIFIVLYTACRIFSCEHWLLNPGWLMIVATVRYLVDDHHPWESQKLEGIEHCSFGFVSQFPVQANGGSPHSCTHLLMIFLGRSLSVWTVDLKSWNLWLSGLQQRIWDNRWEGMLQPILVCVNSRLQKPWFISGMFGLIADYIHTYRACLIRHVYPGLTWQVGWKMHHHWGCDTPELGNWPETLEWSNMEWTITHLVQWFIPFFPSKRGDFPCRTWGGSRLPEQQSGQRPCAIFGEKGAGNRQETILSKQRACKVNQFWKVREWLG